MEKQSGAGGAIRFRRQPSNGGLAAKNAYKGGGGAELPDLLFPRFREKSEDVVIPLGWMDVPFYIRVSKILDFSNGCRARYIRQEKSSRVS